MKLKKFLAQILVYGSNRKVRISKINLNKHVRICPSSIYFKNKKILVNTKTLLSILPFKLLTPYYFLKYNNSNSNVIDSS